MNSVSRKVGDQFEILYTFETEEEYAAYLKFMHSVLNLVPTVEKIGAESKNLAKVLTKNLQDA